MSQDNIVKKFPAVSGNKSSVINQNPNIKERMIVSSGINELTTSSPPQPYKTGNSDVFIPKTCKDVHLGPQYVVREAFHLKSLNKYLIVNINESCKNCKSGKEGRTIRNKIKNNCTIKRCFALGIVITLIEIVLLVFLYRTKAKESDTYFIDVNRIDIMHNNLETFVPRKNWIKGTSDCVYRCPKLKSKIRFVIFPLNYFRCTQYDEYASTNGRILHDCKKIERDETSRNRYRDIYYNYVISDRHISIYEGRSLTCPHDELFLEEDHSSMITVGIDYCYPGRSEVNSELSLSKTDKISDLIKNLQKREMLTRNYVLDFPDFCKNSYLLEKVNRLPDVIYRISFYKQKLYTNLNVSTKIEPKMFSKFLFLPDNTALSDVVLHPPAKAPFTRSELLRVNLYHDCNYLPKISDYDVASTISSRITMKIFLVRDNDLYSLRNATDCNRRTSKNDCLSRIMVYFYEIMQYVSVVDSIENYIIFLPDRISYTTGPGHNSSNLIDHGIVRIFFILNMNTDMSVLDDDTFIWIANEFESIRNKVRSKINFSQVQYQFLYKWQLYEFYYLRQVYQNMVECLPHYSNVNCNISE